PAVNRVGVLALGWRSPLEPDDRGVEQLDRRYLTGRNKGGLPDGVDAGQLESLYRVHRSKNPRASPRGRQPRGGISICHACCVTARACPTLMAMFSLAGKSVVVTGGSKGIGRGIASVFAAAGANVAVAARSTADIDAAVSALDGVGEGAVIGVAADVSD